MHARDVAGFTPLHHCLNDVEGNDLTFQMARILLQNGADPNARNRFGISPIFEAFMFHRLEHIELLLEFGGNLGVTNYSGVSLLHIGVKIHMDLMALFSENMAKSGRILMQKLRMEGKIQTCAMCGIKECEKKCAACHVIYYCR